MNTTKETLSSLNINIGDNFDEFLDSGRDNLNDWLHEDAGGNSDVIYSARAEALYSGACLNERQDAEAMVEECGGFGEGADMASRFATLAYWITYARLEKETREEIEEVIADLEAAQESYDVTVGTLDMLDKIIEAIDCLEAL